MAMINDVVDRHFKAGEFALVELRSLISALDLRIFTAGKAVVSLHDQALSEPKGNDHHDMEEVAAGLEVLLAHLGQAGHLIDQLEKLWLVARTGSSKGAAS
jgi:hypothetical protein